MRGSGTALALLLAVLLFSATAVAQPPRPGTPLQGFVDRHMERLGLDAETRSIIHDVIEVTRSSTDLRRAERVGLTKRMQQLLAVDEPDEGAVLDIVAQLAELDGADQKDRVLALLAIRSVLTPEQRAELIEMRSEPRKPPLRMGPCKLDAQRICSAASPGRATLRCLDESWDQLSGPCRGLFGVPGPSPPAPPAD